VPKSRRHLAQVGAAITAASVTMATAGPALAMHGDGMIDPDGRHHEWRTESLTQGGQTACSWGAAILGTRTNMDTFEGAEDVVCRDGYYNSPPWFGFTQCVNSNWLGITCFDFNIWFELSAAQQSATIDWKYIGCHEFGHTGGVGHQPSGSSCMVDRSGNIDLDQHDIDMVNRDVT
jgi:hypothetical protein